MSRIVVCDTGPLLHLHEANILHLLHLPGEVFYTVCGYHGI